MGKDSKSNRPILQHKSNGDFVSVVDGITFGLMAGRPFHSGRRVWPVEEQADWAAANERFFAVLSDNLRAYRQAVMEKGK
jgi:hypothetical protein